MVYGFAFLPLCLAAYQIAPQKWRRRVLLGFSYLFFWLLSGKLIVYLLGTTVFVHCMGIWLDSIRSEKKKARRVLTFGILVLLGVLAYLKYYNFFVENVTGIFGNALPFTLAEKKILMPVGISFYTLQAIGYMADVYWETGENRLVSCIFSSDHGGADLSSFGHMRRTLQRETSGSREPDKRIYSDILGII